MRGSLWRPAKLRVTAFAVERLDAAGEVCTRTTQIAVLAPVVLTKVMLFLMGSDKAVRHADQVRWRLEYRHMASPAARLLLSSDGEPGGAFALFGRVGRSPRVYAARDRETVLRQIQAAALAKMGITLPGALLCLPRADCSGTCLL